MSLYIYIYIYEIGFKLERQLIGRIRIRTEFRLASVLFFAHHPRILMLLETVKAQNSYSSSMVEMMLMLSLILERT